MSSIRITDVAFDSQPSRSNPPSPRLERRREPIPIANSNPASQYTLLEKLGTGSFGVVYKAIHNETKQIVAIKQIGESHNSERS
jgi:serine/threonine-protein kinase 24/25/MST4